MIFEYLAKMHIVHIATCNCNFLKWKLRFFDLSACLAHAQVGDKHGECCMLMLGKQIANIVWANMKLR